MLFIPVMAKLKIYRDTLRLKFWQTVISL